MIVRRFIVEIHQDQAPHVATMLSDQEIITTINQRLGHLVHTHEIIDAIAVWPTFTQDNPPRGAIIEQSWLPWDQAPRPTVKYDTCMAKVVEHGEG